MKALYKQSYKLLERLIYILNHGAYANIVVNSNKIVLTIGYL